MIQAGLSIKKVRVVNIPQRRSQRLEEFDHKILELHEKMTQLESEGKHIVYIDECIFKARGFQMKAWAAPGQNILVEDRTGKQPCQAVCAAVCSCHNLLAYTITDYSYDEHKFIEFLVELRASHPDGHIVLFFDGAGYHAMESTRLKMEELDMSYVKNVAYKWQYNEAIEKYWAYVKANFRKKLLKKMTTEDPRFHDTPLADAVREAMQETPTTFIPKYIRRGRDFLRADAEEIVAEQHAQL